MAKTALLIEMIELLRCRPGITVPELASSIERSERTIYRWLSELSGEIGAPVYCSDGGYYLSECRSDRPQLSPEELVAVRIALKSPIFAEGSPLRDRAESAWLKIKDYSAHDEVQAANEMSENYSVQLTTAKGITRPGIPKLIETSIAKRHRVKIIYRSQRSNMVKDYTIEPYAMVFRRHSWYLLANSLEHGKVVQFKLVRLREVMDTGVRFEVPTDFSVDDYFRLSWEAWAGGEPTAVRVRFDPSVAMMIAETQRHPTQRIRPLLDGGIIFEATVAGIEEFAVWVMGFGRDAEVLEPVELRELIAEHALGMVDRYGEAGWDSHAIETNTTPLAIDVGDPC